MPLPANVTTVTVLGTFLTPEGDPSTGTVSFTPSSWLLNSGANIAIPNSSVVKTLGTAGDFSAVLPITDDPDLSPGGWVYSVSAVVDGVSQSYNIAIPGTVAAGGTVFLADLAPVAPAGPEYYSLASSLAIGTVSTVPTGGSATASITGLAPSQVLNLGIPVGATGTVASAGSGSVGTAAVAPQGDPDTGIYFPAANQVAITTGGSAAATFAAGAISNPTFTGVASFPDGSASAPSITNTGDTNTGLFHPADDTVAISTGGTERLRVTSAGATILGSGATLGIGIPTSVAPEAGIRSQGVNTAYFDRNTDDANPPNVSLRKSRGTTTTPTVVQSGDVLGSINFRGYDGTDYSNFAYIRGYADTTPGPGDLPGRLAFFTVPDGSTAITERMRIDSNGLITGTGTSLGAWTAYTPTLTGTGWALGNGTIAGIYCQIGKIVVWRAVVTFGSTSSFGTGNPGVSYPLNSVSTTAGLYPHARAIFNDVSLAKFYEGACVSGAVSGVAARSLTTSSEHTTTNSTTPFTWADGDVIRFSGTYEAA